MSLGQDIKIESDKRTQVEAETLKAGFLDQGFINTMRFSELNGLEEYDNSFLWILWHSYIEWGLGQMFQYNAWILRELEILFSGTDESSKIDDKPKVTLSYVLDLLNCERVMKTIPYDQRSRIYRYFTDWSKVIDHINKKTGVPLDSHTVMWLLRTYIAQYNENFTDGIVLFDGHYGILNGRMARAKGHMRDLLKVTSDRKEREREVRMGHWWNRNKNNGEDEN